MYARHTVKFGLIAPLRQASHFPVFCWLSTCPEHSHIECRQSGVPALPVRDSCWAFFRAARHAHFGSPHVTEMVVGSHCISWLVPLENVRVGPMSPTSALDGPTHRHGESCVGLLLPADSDVG